MNARRRVPGKGAAKPRPKAPVKAVKPESKSPRAKAEIKPEIKTEIVAIILFAAAVLLFLGVFVSEGGGFLGVAVNSFLVGITGFGAYTLPFIALLWGMVLLVKKGGGLVLPRFFMCLGLFVIIISFVHMINVDDALVPQPFGERAVWLFQNGGASNGGLIGGLFSGFLSGFLGRAGAYVAMVAGLVVLLTVVTGKSLFKMLMLMYLRMGAQMTKFRETSHKLHDDEAEYEEDFNYNPGAADEYVYETRGRPAKTPAKPKSAPKSGGRKVFDYVISDDEDDAGEPEIFLMDEPKTPPEKDLKQKDFSHKIVSFSKDEEVAEDEGIAEDEGLPAWKFSREEEPKPLTPEKEELADKALAGLASMTTGPGSSDLDISIRGTGVEGYVPITVTATGASDELVEADIDNDGLFRLPLTAPEEKIILPQQTHNTAEKPYTLPSVDLLTKNSYTPSPSSKAQILENSRKLEETLKSFGVEARVVEVSKGPTVTRYELSPGVGVKVSKISNLADDLALNLAALGIRIEAPIPGKSVVGIEIPNSEVQTVFLRDVVDDDGFWAFSSKLGFAVGKDIAGNSVIVDIAKMPHLLIAGATGAGKSVCINTIIASILLKSSPDEVKMLMIDPKVVELNVYNGIPHLEIPVVTDPHKAAGALSWGVREMNERYNAFARTGTRDLKGYNESLVAEGEKALPQIIIIIDELADLMMSCKADVEQNICRLAQKARAAGIHLIIATQRPSVDVITGLIKANVPSRLAFAVTSGTDSRTILDMNGAEKLLGKGDMLFSPAGLSKPQRIQGAFISDKEVERLVQFIKKENGEAVYDADKIERITANSKDEENDSFGDDADEHIREAISFVTDRGKASVSMLQRQFRIGYNRAARMMDMLEERGIVGPEDGAKPRKVLVGPRAYEDV